MIYYVDGKVKVSGDGSINSPFKRIQQAANIAMPGDEVLVASGIYHEEVSPVFAGTESHPIVYKSIDDRGALITGADSVTGWEYYQKDVWKIEIDNEYFGNYNPYTTIVFGDWLNQSTPVHTGEVFINEKSLYEVDSLEKVVDPVFYDASWDRDFTKHTWFTCQSKDRDATIIYANFQGKNPNEETVEISVRPHCFYPAQ